MKKIDYNELFVPTYKRDGAPLVKGKGIYLYDSDGKKYLDFGAGIAVNALGHAHPTLRKTICEQGAMLLHGSNLYFTENQIKLAKKLLKSSFGDRVFFCNSGTEANEAAIKFARKWAKTISKDKFHILSFYDGFHGRTYGALSATAQSKLHEGFEPMVEGFHYSKFNDIDETRKVLKKHEYAAVFVEPIQGEGGVICASKEFLAFLREYCDKHEIALVFDEIQCGMGRTGTLWGYEQYDVVPDMMTLAKPLGGGLPLGAVISKDFITSAISPGDHGTTFGGNSLACALGCELFDIVSQKSFLKDVRKRGEYLKKKLSELKDRNDLIEDIRGLGLIFGVQLKGDPLKVVSLCKENGLLLVKAGNHTVRFLPPLIVTKDDIDKALVIFEKVLKSFQK